MAAELCSILEKSSSRENLELATMTNNRIRQLSVHVDDPLRELFESCKTGNLVMVRKLINPQTVNSRDTAGRKSTPLHFAAGKCLSLSSAQLQFTALALRHPSS